MLAILLGPVAIRWLKSRFRERIDSGSDGSTNCMPARARLPPWAGCSSWGRFCSHVLWGDLSNRYVQIGLVRGDRFAALGAIDDWIKLSTTRNGLTVRQKFAAQIGARVRRWLVLYLRTSGQPHGTGPDLAVRRIPLPLGAGFIVGATFVLVGSSNARQPDRRARRPGRRLHGLRRLGVRGAQLSGRPSVLADYLSIPFMPGAGELAS